MTAFAKIVAELIAQRQQILETCEEILHGLLDNSGWDDKRKRAEREREIIAGQIQTLVERQARETVEAFAEKYQELEKKYMKAEQKLTALDAERKDRAYCRKQAELFMTTLKQVPEDGRMEYGELFMTLVEKVIVGQDLTFELRDGSRRVIRY